MSQSLSRLYVHIIFHIKEKQVTLRQEEIGKLYSYIGGIIKQCDSIPIQINGTQNHVHVLCVLSKNIALAKLVQQIKAGSSEWIKTLDMYYSNFSWQKGYAAFSVSASVHSKTVQYILRQQEHHRKICFKEELLLFLKEYNIEYDEKYLWVDD